MHPISCKPDQPYLNLALIARFDLEAYRTLFAPGSLQMKMINAAQQSLSHHTWYLTQELVVFSLWDEKVSSQERQELARRLLRMRPPVNFVWQTGKPVLPNLPNRFTLASLGG